MKASRRYGLTLTAIATATACLLAGCDASQNSVSVNAAECSGDAIQPHAVQGDDWRSPLTGQTVTVQGIVTRMETGGFFIESTQPDSRPQTSEGLYIAAAGVDSDLFHGAVVLVTGQVAELGESRDTHTALIEISDINQCDGSSGRPETIVKLPFNSRQREALENMRISVSNRSMVTDVYRLRNGELRVSGDMTLPIPTEVARPGKEAQRQQQKNWDNNLYVQLAKGDDQAFAIGTELVSDTGVLGHDGKGPRLMLETPPRLNTVPIPDIEPPQKAHLRVVSLNLQNYFNGDGRGRGFPTPRGAENKEEFKQQRSRIRAGLRKMQPHIVGVMEIENDGFAKGSAARDFIEDLEWATKAEWAVVKPSSDRVGTDEIAVGIFYRPDSITAVGPAQLVDAPAFDLLNRVPVNQLFEHPATGEQFWLSINHFKSKGRCPDQGRDRNQNDGQGCWNSARTQAAESLQAWLSQRAREGAKGRALVMGDLNAYRIEDPVQHFISERWADLTAAPVERHNFSYAFRGETGTLDHALSTQAMSEFVAQALIWHINSPYPPGMELRPDYLRSSDHDPVVVDLRFIQSSTSD